MNIAGMAGVAGVYINCIVNTSICIYLLWIVLHYISPHLYVHFCVPLTLQGFIMSPFIAPSPHCQALRWAIYNGGNTIIAMWVVFGTWIMQKLITTKTNY
jgi:hypothetical protein